jgi:hypothetical protein
MIVKPIKIGWHQDLSIFASENFLRAVGDEYGWLGGFDEAGNLRCFLPFTIIIKKPFFKLVRYRVETIPVVTDFGVEEEKTFLNLVVNYFKIKHGDVIIPATTNTIFRTYPDGATAAPYGTYKIDLTQSESELLAKMSASHRRKVRLAQKNQVTIKTGPEYAQIAYEMVKDTFKRSHLGFMKYKVFERYLDGLGDQVKIFVAEQAGEIQACLVVPFSRFSAYYVYGGSLPEPVQGATNLLHWEAMLYFKQAEVKFYDFVGVRINPEKGSKQEGLSQYKERFGGKLCMGYMWKYNLSPVKSLAYSLAVKLLKGGDIVDCEKHKLSSFNINQ